ncbi:MAG: ATP-binding cassette domain-containing protein [Spirochaetia bacterium]|nr:ATP-binding cassette domain-containing protein [Spirochaetia bacterium]
MEDNILIVKNLSKEFPIYKGLLRKKSAIVKAVNDVSFEIHRGETLGLVGESGSGKTTLGRLILRAIEPTSGEVTYNFADETNVDFLKLNKKQLKKTRTKIQMVFQDPYSSLNPRMTVRDIIAETLVANKTMSRSEIDNRVREIADLCKLNLEHLRRFPHAFSGGQRQRIGIARALAVNPEFVVCDESVSALDVSVQAEIINLFKELQVIKNITYLFIAHDLSIVEHISDRIIVMYLGQIVEEADKKTLFENPMHPYTEALMSAIPEPDPLRKMAPIFLEGEIPNPMNLPTGCYFHPRCHYATEQCKKEMPCLRCFGNHKVACHRAEELHLKQYIKY